MSVYIHSSLMSVHFMKFHLMYVASCTRNSSCPNVYVRICTQYVHVYEIQNSFILVKTCTYMSERCTYMFIAENVQTCIYQVHACLYFFRNVCTCLYFLVLVHTCLNRVHDRYVLQHSTYLSCTRFRHVYTRLCQVGRIPDVNFNLNLNKTHHDVLTVNQ